MPTEIDHLMISNTHEVRRILSEEITLLRDGKIQPQRANAICNMVGKIISSAKLDLEYAKYKNVKPISFEKEQIENKSGGSGG